MPTSHLLLRVVVAVAFLLALAVSLPATTGDPLEPDPWVSVGFAVVRSRPDNAEAPRVAQTASAQPGLKLNLRDLVYEPEQGLTLPKEEWEKDSPAP